MCAYADSYGDGWFDQHLDVGNWRTWNGLTPMKEARRFYLVGGDEWTRSANGNASSDRKKIVLAGAPCQIMGLIL